MKYIITLALGMLFTFHSFSQTKNYYTIIDADQANMLFDGLKTDSTVIRTGYPQFPLPTETVEDQVLKGLGWGLAGTLDHYFSVVEKTEVDEDYYYTVKVRSIDIYDAKLAGVVPPVKLDCLKSLSLTENHIENIHPDIELPALEGLWMRRCGLEVFPNIPFPNLIDLALGENNISGEIPALNLPRLGYLEISDNNISGNLVLDAPNLYNLNARRNNLSGSLESINAPTLNYFYITNNSFSGTFNLPGISTLINIEASGNKFDGIPNDFKERFPKLDELDFSINNFEFDDIQSLLDLELPDGNLDYRTQRHVPLKIETLTDKHKLTADVGGASGYQWMYITPSSQLRDLNPDSIWYAAWYVLATNLGTAYGIEPINNATTKTYEIEKNENPVYYACVTSNSAFPNLLIPAIANETKQITCWENDYFSFCFLESDAEWGEGDNKNEIKATKPLSINGFMNFEGNLTIDTSALTIKTDGKLFIENIPIPGGGNGNFTLAQGEYELAIGGSDGKITGFINDALSTFTPDIGGLELKLEELSLVGGKSADGISTTFQVSWDNITPSCGGPDQTSAIKLSGLSITRSSGINVEGMQVTDLGLAPGFCVKDLNAAYSSDEDKLTFGLTLLTPFIEVGGGLGLVGGEIDSVAFKAVLQDAIIPLGSTGVGIIGVEGRINSITNPPPNMKFGGILSSVLNDNLFQLTTSIEYIPPSELKLELGDGKFFNPPFYDDWWLGEGGVYGQLDFKTYRLKLGGELKFSPYRDDDGNKKFMASGATELAYRSSPVGGRFIGTLNGEVVIPKLDDDWPYDWINAQLGLPHSIGGEALLVYRTGAKYITGNVNFGGKIGKVRYDVNLSKSYNEEGFFSFQAEEINLALNPTTRSEVEMNIPKNTPLTVVKISMDRAGNEFYVIDPNGNSISPDDLGDHAEWSFDSENNKGFLTLNDPMSGIWFVITEGMDSIDYYIFNENIAISVEATATDEGILISWDPELLDVGEFIEIYIDNDNVGMDGTWLMDIPASVGSYTIPYIDIEGFCDFYIMSLVNIHGQIQTGYDDDKFSNTYSSFIPIEDLEWTYHESSKTLDMNWREITDEELAGYTINRITESGNVNLALLYPSENHFTTIIDNFVPEEISIFSYGVNGESSCPLYLKSSTGIEEILPEEKLRGKIVISPNPVGEQLNIRYDDNSDLPVVVNIINTMGEVIQSHPGVKDEVEQMTIEVKNLIPGFYYLQFVVDEVWETRPFIKL